MQIPEATQKALLKKPRRCIAICFAMTAAVVILFAAVWVQQARAWTEECTWTCSSNDVNVTRLWLGDVDGNDLSQCSPGDTVYAYVWAQFENNTNSDRYACIFVGDFFVDGALVARHRNMEDIALNPTEKDAFGTKLPFMSEVLFQRDDQGTITAFQVSNGRTRGVIFERE